jgi:hypothetical protein
MKLSAKTLKIISTTCIVLAPIVILWDLLMVKDNSHNALLSIGGSLLIFGIIIAAYSKKKKDQESKIV